MDQENQHIELEKLLNEYILIEQSIISSKIENDIGEEDIDKKSLEIVEFFRGKTITEGFIKKVVKQSRKKKSALLSCIGVIYRENPEDTKNWMIPFITKGLHSKDDTERYYALQSLYVSADAEVTKILQDILSDMILTEQDVSCTNQLLHIIQFHKNEKMLLTLIDVINNSGYKNLSINNIELS